MGCVLYSWGAGLDVDSITEFMDFLYTVNIRQHVPDVMCWNPSPHAIFEVKSFESYSLW
jgi:ribosomal protein L31E